MTHGKSMTVAVIGGGPAGASTALELARLGIDTVLIERSDGSGNPIGECLAPSANTLFLRPGLDDVLRSSGSLPSYGNRSSWGGEGRAASRDFLREPFGNGWHLDRPAFNRALLNAVERAGVTVMRERRVTSLERTGGGWRIATTSPEGDGPVDAGFLVDASGRRAFVARQEGVRRRILDSQVAAVAVLDAPGHAVPMQDATTLVEAAASGWWYAALLPTRRLVVAWFSDPDLLAKGAAWRPAEWWDLLGASGLIGEVVTSHGLEIPQRIRVVAAGSTLLTQPFGQGWIAVGDASAAYDPLSSHGIGSALTGGRSAVRAVAASINGDRAAFEGYRDRLFADYAHYLWMRRAYHADEQRWPHEPFWERRHGSIPP